MLVLEHTCKHCAANDWTQDDEYIKCNYCGSKFPATKVLNTKRRKLTKEEVKMLMSVCTVPRIRPSYPFPIYKDYRNFENYKEEKPNTDLNINFPTEKR